MSFWREVLGLGAPAPKKAPFRKRSAYHAGEVSRLFADFQGTYGSADADLRGDLVLMRNRARQMARDDVYVKRFLELLETNVIGDQGMVLQVKARDTAGGMDVIGNRIVEDAWTVFGQVGNCTADGLMSMVDLEKYVVRTVARDGEAFVQVIRNNSFVHGIAFHAFEADMVDVDKTEKRPNGNDIRMGIEVDSFGRPVAFWVKKNHPGDNQFTSVTRNESVRVPAGDILHVYRRVRAGQTRGETWLHAALSQIKMLNAHREAELVASRMAASKMGFFTSETGEEAPADGYDNGVPIIEAEPGTFHQLPAGVDFKAFNPDHPATAFAEFQKNILRGTASGLGVSYASLSGDLSDTSYSSVRQGALEERDQYRSLQKFFLDHFVARVYATWLRHVMEFGYINLPATKFDKFFSATTFRPRGWQWVDPQKEISAAGEALHLGIMSPQDVAAQYGRDFEETQSQWERDRETAATYGNELAYGPFGGNPQAKGMPEQAEEPVAAPEPARAAPVEVSIKHTELAPAKRAIKLVRDEDGLVIGAEIAEDENGN
jgi:lambda family phage portal protein